MTGPDTMLNRCPACSKLATDAELAAGVCCASPGSWSTGDALPTPARTLPSHSGHYFRALGDAWAAADRRERDAARARRADERAELADWHALRPYEANARARHLESWRAYRSAAGADPAAVVPLADDAARYGRGPALRRCYWFGWSGAEFARWRQTGAELAAILEPPQ